MPTISDRTEIFGILRDPATDLSGYSVEAIDEHAGTLAKKQDEVDDSHLVIHVGPHLVGHDVVVEADVVDRIDTDEHVIHVDRIAKWVKSSPKLKDYQRAH
ncbi:MAG TPA: hypothetical protein VMM13_10330 [Euzebya sp.]|nr:hypothetical protein [Euzebya sp.]